MVEKSDISHKGRIVEITPEFTTVEIVSEAACAGCHAAGFCGLSGSATKAVRVPTVSYPLRQLGQEVELVIRKSMGYKAVWLAYVFPLIVLLAVLLGLVALGAGQLEAGLSALGAVAVYYLLLWIFRDRLSNEYSFHIKDTL
ncbi:MAG: SoxR reducing system RseC family protein [Bacteroidales bacterium]|nr:SoxR reducing system RseC family protein [Bacteroidales bacterium]